MVSLYRLKGRALQIDNSLIMTLTFFTGLILLVTVNFLPALYRNLVLPLFSFGEVLFSVTAEFAVASVFLLTSFGFYSSVRLGTKRYLLKKAQKKKPQVNDIFFYFTPKRYFSAFFYSVKTALVKLSLLAFCIAPSLICLAVVDRFSRQGVSALVCLSLTVTAVCLLVNGGVFYSLFYSSFFLCDYYYIEGTCLNFRHLLSCSQKSMCGKNTLLTRLKLSFAGWFLLCLLLLPVPYVWGYYNQSLAVAAAEFMKGKEG